MKKIILNIIFIGAGLTSIAQQQYQHSQYQTNPFLMNPAASGIYEYVDISAGVRQQWVGFNNAPRNFFISGHTPLGRGNTALYNPSLRIGGRGPVQTPDIKTGKMKHAVGGYMFADEYGAFKHINAMGTYSIHVPVMRGYNLSAGIGIGYSSYRFDQNEVDMLDNSDVHYMSFLGNGTQKGYLDMTAGLWFYSNNLFVGYSGGELLRTMVSFGSAPADYNLRMHHFITAGYKFDISKEFSLTPSFLIKMMSPAPLSMDFSLKGTYNKFIWGGVTYRHQDAIVGMIGMNINELIKFGYSYDFSISDMNNYNKGGHEIVLGVTLGR